MIGGLPAGTRIWLAAGVTDMRFGMPGLAAKVQTQLDEQIHDGHAFVFRGRRGDLIKILWFSGDGMNLYAKRLELGRFICRNSDLVGQVGLTPSMNRIAFPCLPMYWTIMWFRHCISGQ